jgi:hypothetical protein
LNFMLASAKLEIVERMVGIDAALASGRRTAFLQRPVRNRCRATDDTPQAPTTGRSANAERAQVPICDASGRSVCRTAATTGQPLVELKAAVGMSRAQSSPIFEQ